MFAAKGLSRDSTSSGFGFPRSSMILSIWFNVEVPGNIAFPMTNSPIMQPINE